MTVNIVAQIYISINSYRILIHYYGIPTESDGTPPRWLCHFEGAVTMERLLSLVKEVESRGFKKLTSNGYLMVYSLTAEASALPDRIAS